MTENFQNIFQNYSPYWQSEASVGMRKENRQQIQDISNVVIIKGIIKYKTMTS